MSRILVVDDDETIRDTLYELLSGNTIARLRQPQSKH